MTGRLGGIGSPAGENPGSTRLRTDLHWFRVLYGDAGENPLAYRSSLNLKLKVLDFVKFGGPILTVDRTIFEMWLGDCKSTEAADPGIVA